MFRLYYPGFQKFFFFCYLIPDSSLQSYEAPREYFILGISRTELWSQVKAVSS